MCNLILKYLSNYYYVILKKKANVPKVKSAIPSIKVKKKKAPRAYPLYLPNFSKVSNKDNFYKSHFYGLAFYYR